MRHAATKKEKGLLWSQLIASYMNYVLVVSARYKRSRKQTDSWAWAFVEALSKKELTAEKQSPRLYERALLYASVQSLEKPLQ